MCLSSLKNACEVAGYYKVADSRLSKIYEIWTLSTGIFTTVQYFFLKKSLPVFFRKGHWNMLEQNI